MTDEYNWEEPPPFIINVFDDGVNLITDNPTPGGPIQCFVFPFDMWDRIVEYVERVRRGAQIPDRNWEVTLPLITAPIWDDYSIKDLLKGLDDKSSG